MGKTSRDRRRLEAQNSHSPAVGAIGDLTRVAMDLARGPQPQGWSDFVPNLGPDLPGGKELQGRSRWRSTEYTVTRTELVDGSTWLSISRYGTRGPVRDWRHLQKIKNVLTDPEREGVEIFPAESRLVDSADQYHIFCLPVGQRVQYGYANREVGGPLAAREHGAGQRPFEDEVIPPEGAEAVPPDASGVWQMQGPGPVYAAYIAAAQTKMMFDVDQHTADLVAACVYGFEWRGLATEITVSHTIPGIPPVVSAIALGLRVGAMEGEERERLQRVLSNLLEAGGKAMLPEHLEGP